MDAEPRTLTLKPIGYISTPFKDRYDAPRQSGIGAPQLGIITLNPNENFETALEDLAGFEKIWLLYWFDRNEHWKPKVLPPRGSEIKRGMFATRSPHRPNPIGLSLVDVLSIEGRVIRVSGVDLLDGTPIFDIKPYLAYSEAFPDARMGWLENSDNSETGDVKPTQYVLHWSTLATEQLVLLEHYGIALRDRAEHILSHSPFPHPYRRVKDVGDGLFEFAIRSWRLVFRVEEHLVKIQRIKSGYNERALKSARNDDLHDGPAHRVFHGEWPEEIL
jgi:tRNA-Thr(GGU) m(6)t(6)A37 methyltransferase TsaA